MPNYYSINQFVYANDLQPADVVVMKKGLGILAHYIVYLGVYDGQHTFVANVGNGRGVQVLSRHQIQTILPKFWVARIRYFNGNSYQREGAVQRAINLIAYKYDLASFNCEHFANYVQTGRSYSQQSKNVGNIALATAGIAILSAIFKEPRNDDDEEYA